MALRGGAAAAAADDDGSIDMPQIQQVMKWYREEEEYLRNLYLSCLDLSKEYMKMYTRLHRVQSRLRLPAIILSSFSGVASFGSSGFDPPVQRIISISVGIINVGIAIIQTYESYIKIGEMVSKSLAGSQNLKKLADDIMCELSLPIEDRDSNGVTFLREIFGRYQAFIDNLPPLELNFDMTIIRESQDLQQRISVQRRAMDERLAVAPPSTRPSIVSGPSAPNEIRIEINPLPPPPPVSPHISPPRR